MIRLFVAVRPPVAVRDALLDCMGGVAGARWQDDDQLHCTLRFIGEVDRRTADDVAAALGSIRHPPIAARLGRFGSFARRGRPDALWIGVEPAPALTALHHKVDQACIRAGLPPEARAYVPHITLARLGRDAGPVGGFVARLPPLATFEIGTVALFESILTRIGATYRPLLEVDFARE